MKISSMILGAVHKLELPFAIIFKSQIEAKLKITVGYNTLERARKL